MKVEDALGILAVVIISAMVWLNIQSDKVIRQQRELIIEMYASGCTGR